MTTYRDVFDSRDRLNPKIVDRLRKYGTLEPAGIYGRPYNGGAKHGQEYPLSRANYLRLVSMQDEAHIYHDPRWVWQETARKNGWVLKPTARAAMLEVYRRGDDGKAVPELWKFYNVEDFKNYPYEKLEIKGDRPEDFRQAIGILKDNGIDISWKANSEQIFNAVKQYAKERGEDEFSAPMTAHLFLKTNYLSYDYRKHPLYSDEQLKKLEKNTKIIFAAVKRAQNLYDKMESIQEKIQRQEQAVVEAARGKMVEVQQEPRRNGLFQELYVDFAWSETPIRNEKGEAYKEGIHLNGEEAYKFLVAFNAQDKEVYNDKMRGLMSYNKVKMAISYGKYHETSYRIRELGKLNLCNEVSLATGLERHFNAYRTALLEMPEVRQNLLRKNQGLTDEMIQEKSQAANEFCSREMQKMRGEEKLYLELHPEIAAINARKADTYLYVAKKEDFKRLPSAFILTTMPVEETEELQVAENKGDYHTFREGIGIKSDEVAFESARPINSAITRGLPIHMALDADDQVAFINMMGKLKLEVENTGPVMEGHAPEKISYVGITAIDMLARLKQQDLEGARQVQQAGFIDRKTVEQQHLILYYGQEKLAEVIHEEGCGRLTGDVLGLLKLSGESAELKDIMRCAVKMKGGADSPEVRALVDDEPVKMPSLEERRNKALAAKPNSHALNRDLYRYYEKAALQDFKAISKEDVMAGMIKIMEQAGLRPVKIANIARTNPDFKTELLPKVSYAIKENRERGQDGGKFKVHRPAGQKLTMEEQADLAAKEATKRAQKDLLKAAYRDAHKKMSPKEVLVQDMEGSKIQGRKRELSR